MRGETNHIWKSLGIWVCGMALLFALCLGLDLLRIAGGGWHERWLHMAFPSFFMALLCGICLWLGAREEALRIRRMKARIPCGVAGAECPGFSTCGPAEFWRQVEAQLETQLNELQRELDNRDAALARAKVELAECQQELGEERRKRRDAETGLESLAGRGRRLARLLACLGAQTKEVLAITETARPAATARRNTAQEKQNLPTEHFELA